MPELIKIERELDEIKKKNFWKLYIEAIIKERENAVNHCVQDIERENIRFYQGKVRVIDDILAFPDRILKELRKKAGERLPSR